MDNCYKDSWHTSTTQFHLPLRQKFHNNWSAFQTTVVKFDFDFLICEIRSLIFMQLEYLKPKFICLRKVNAHKGSSLAPQSAVVIIRRARSILTWPIQFVALFAQAHLGLSRGCRGCSRLAVVGHDNFKQPWSLSSAESFDRTTTHWGAGERSLFLFATFLPRCLVWYFTIMMGIFARLNASFQVVLVCIETIN